MITPISPPHQAHTVPTIKDFISFTGFVQSIKALNKTNAKKINNLLSLGNCTFRISGNYQQYI